MEYALPSRKPTRSEAKSGGDLKMIPIAKLCKITPERLMGENFGRHI